MRQPGPPLQRQEKVLLIQPALVLGFLFIFANDATRNAFNRAFDFLCFLLAVFFFLFIYLPYTIIKFKFPNIKNYY